MFRAFHLKNLKCLWMCSSRTNVVVTVNRTCYCRTQINNVTVISAGSHSGLLLRKCNPSDTINIDFRHTAYSCATVIWNVFAFRQFLRAFWILISFRMMEILSGIADKNNQSFNPLNVTQSRYRRCRLRNLYLLIERWKKQISLQSKDVRSKAERAEKYVRRKISYSMYAITALRRQARLCNVQCSSGIPCCLPNSSTPFLI